MKTVLLAFALLVTGCINAGYPPPDTMPAEYTACDAPEDCTIVELGCCDSCNGGEARSVNAEHVDDVRTRYTEVCQLGQGCTEMGCSPLEATCEDDVCGMQAGEF